MVIDHYHAWEGYIRKLWPAEVQKLRNQLFRLGRDGRRLRFAYVVSDQFICDKIRAAAEL